MTGSRRRARGAEMGTRASLRLFGKLKPPLLLRRPGPQVGCVFWKSGRVLRADPSLHAPPHAPFPLSRSSSSWGTNDPSSRGPRSASGTGVPETRCSDTVCKRSVDELWFSAGILPVGSASFHPRPPLRGVPDLDKGRLLRPLVVIHGKVFPDTSRKHLSWLKSSNFCSCIALQNKNLPPCCYFLLPPTAISCSLPLSKPLRNVICAFHAGRAAMAL
ncbi:uncharacterized protein LOC116598261 isoform X1 [Mustela erminea]|uniref:uncharacterized protein LOC116598261 isoform X1 n=1 Tax=Mustela erminea TaxID=36723 RepID=UPI001386BC6F|nr:uncharacterized protein LOC116598261 isoform X1 [Mustela erminea]